MKKMHRFAATLTLLASAGMPALAVAAGISTTELVQFSNGIISLINGVLVPLLLGVAFIVFLYGLYKYFIWNNDSETEKMEGRKFAMWGIVGFVVIFSVWGLVNLVKGAFLFTNTGTPTPPTFTPSSGR